MNKIDLLISLLQNYSGEVYSFEYINKISDKEIKDFERKNIFVIPEDFKYYLLNYNGIQIGGIEIFSINKNNKLLPDINDIIKFETNKKTNPMPNYLIPFSSNGRGDYYCFNKKDNKIYFWQHDCYDLNWNPDFDNETFTNRLEENLKNALDNL